MAEFLVWLQKLLECATREAPAWKDTIQTVVYNRGQAARSEFAGKCWNCNATGHRAVDCPKPRRRNLTDRTE